MLNTETRAYIVLLVPSCQIAALNIQTHVVLQVSLFVQQPLSWYGNIETTFNTVSDTVLMYAGV